MNAFRRFLSKFTIFILSLLLAILIWIIASQENDPTLLQSFQIPVDIVGQIEASNLDISTKTIVVVVEAPSSVMQTLGSDDFSAVIDLRDVVVGEEVALPITVNTKTSGVSINSYSPEAVDVLLEQLVTKDVPVVLDIRGSVARGHTQGDALIDPATITVVGTADQVEPLDAARVTVFLNNVRDTFTSTPFPVFYDRQGQIASVSGLDKVSAESVAVTIPVQESADFAEKIIDVDWSGSPADGYRLLSINVEPPSALLQGSPSRLNGMTQLSTEPIDITGLTETFVQPVTLELPNGITLDAVQGYTVTVEIEPIFTTAVYNRPIEFQGIEKGMDAIATPEEARVVLFGPLPILDSLTEDEVNVTVDAFGLVTGTYSLEPVVTFPDRGLELRSIQPPLITVEITPTMTNTITNTETSRLYDGVEMARAELAETSVAELAEASHPITPILSTPRIIANWVRALPKENNYEL